MLKKKCQIRAFSPVTCFSVPIVGTAELNLTEDEIYQCLCSKAEVIEILSNGERINLNFVNYNRDNSIIGEPAVIEEEPVVAEEVIEEVPVVFIPQLSIEEETEEVEVAETISIEEPEVEEEIEEVMEVSDEIEIEEDTVKAAQVKPRNDNYKKNKKNNNRK